MVCSLIRWLAGQGRLEEAEQVLRGLGSPQDDWDDVAQLHAAAAAASSSNARLVLRPGLLSMLRSPILAAELQIGEPPDSRPSLCFPRCKMPPYVQPACSCVALVPDTSCMLQARPDLHAILYLGSLRGASHYTRSQRCLTKATHADTNP